MRYARWVLYATGAICATMLYLALSKHAKAQDIEEGTGVICDTPDQIERFASLNMEMEALTVINADAKENVCAMVEVRYYRGRKLGMYRVGGIPVQVVEIMAVAYKADHWITLQPWSIQYTLFLVEEEGI